MRPVQRRGRVAALVALVLGCAAPDDRPDILLITLDTTRADHLGVYGYARSTSPRLDAFAKSAMVYDRALSSATWTLPAHASLFTGKLPSSHGAQHDQAGELRLGQVLEGGSSEQIRARTISPDEVTLASVLRDAGYATAAVVAGPWMMRVFGLDAGFESYDDDGIRSLGGRWGKSVTLRALEWLDATPRGPRFLFLNYFDAHGPFDPPERYLEAVGGVGDRPRPEEVAAGLPAGTIDRYDAEIRYQDDALGALLDGLRERGLFENCWIWITADHGELFGEHGERGHADLPYRETVQVPLIVKAPGPDPPTGRVSTPIQITDVMPIVLTRLGLPLPPGIQGRPNRNPEGPIVVESRTLPLLKHRGSWRALYEGRWKYVWNSAGNSLLFDLDADPAEDENLVARHPEIAAQMESRLEMFVSALPAPGRGRAALDVDPETREALRAVGYLGE